MKKTKILLIGHSHTQCFIDAYGAEMRGVLELDAIRLHRDKIVGGEPDFADYIAGQVKKLEVAHAGGLNTYDAVVLLLGGNTHNVLGLVEMSPPFDFVLSSQPSLPVSARARLLPEAVIKGVLLQRIETMFLGMNVIRQMFGGAMYCLESPPPIGDDDYVRRYLDEHFRKDFENNRDVVSAQLRYKLWKVSSAIYSERSRQLGISYVECPESVLVDGMYLRPEGYPLNATHGNAWYGGKVLENFLDIFSKEVR